MRGHIGLCTKNDEYAPVSAKLLFELLLAALIRLLQCLWQACSQVTRLRPRLTKSGFEKDSNAFKSVSFDRVDSTIVGETSSLCTGCKDHPDFWSTLPCRPAYHCIPYIPVLIRRFLEKFSSAVTGLFVPSLFTGAAIGRCVGVLVQAHHESRCDCLQSVVICCDPCEAGNHEQALFPRTVEPGV